MLPRCLVATRALRSVSPLEGPGAAAAAVAAAEQQHPHTGDAAASLSHFNRSQCAFQPPAAAAV